MYKPRYCGLCSDGRCCTPHNTKTIQVEFRCPQGKFLKKPMMLINTCVCHSNCPQSNNAFFQQLDPASSEAKIWNAWFVLPKRYVVHTKLDPQSGECNNCICKISKIFSKLSAFVFPVVYWIPHLTFPPLQMSFIHLKETVPWTEPSFFLNSGMEITKRTASLSLWV